MESDLDKRLKEIENKLDRVLNEMEDLEALMVFLSDKIKS